MIAGLCIARRAQSSESPSAYRFNHCRWPFLYAICSRWELTVSRVEGSLWQLDLRRL